MPGEIKMGEILRDKREVEDELEKIRSDLEYTAMRNLIDALYDHQDVRIRSMSRARAIIRRKLLDLGFEPEKKKKEPEAGEEPKEEVWADKKMEQLLKTALKQKKVSAREVRIMLELLELAKKETEIEKIYEAKVTPFIKSEQIWTSWLESVKGIGIRNAARLLKHFGYCEDFESVSKIWAFSGYAPDRFCVICKRYEHLHVKNKETEEREICTCKHPQWETENPVAVRKRKGVPLPYNPKVHVDCYVIGSSLMKAKGKYKRFYDAERAKIGVDEKYSHRKAFRKMVKLFLSHYWNQTRTIKGLPTRDRKSVV